MKSASCLNLLVVAILSASCSHEPTAPQYRAVLRTDQASYFAPLLGTGDNTRTVKVILQYANQSEAPIYLQHCPGTAQPSFGTQSIGSDGVALGTSDMVAGACAGGAGISVAAGAIRTDTFVVIAPAPLPATIRFFYLAASCTLDGGVCLPLLPESDRVTAPIRVFAGPSR